MARRACIAAVLFGLSVVALGGCATTPRPAARTSPPISTTRASSATTVLASPCSRQDLDASYVGGGDGGQTFMGAIAVWNVGSRACVISGAVDFAAHSATGDVDAQATPIVAQPFVSVTLPAAMASFQDKVSDPDSYLYAQLAAPQFDAEALCTVGIAPATFTLTIGTLTFQVANHDPDAVQNKILSGCKGRVLLERIYPPSGA